MTFILYVIFQHPDYQKDSIVSESITYDLLCEIDKIAKGDEKKLFEYLTVKL